MMWGNPKSRLSIPLIAAAVDRQHRLKNSRKKYAQAARFVHKIVALRFFKSSEALKGQHRESLNP
jgi:phage regulator Rha-like protein